MPKSNGRYTVAVVAVARKLAVLLLSMWKHGTDYERRVPAPVPLVMVVVA